MKNEAEIKLIQCSFFDEEKREFLFLAYAVIPPRVGEIVELQDHTAPLIPVKKWVVRSVSHGFRKELERILYYSVGLSEMLANA